MEKPREIKTKNEVTYFQLNNQLNRVVDGNIDLKKDKEAVRALFLEEINPNTVFFHTLDEKLNYLIREDYLDEEKLSMYDRKFIKKLMKQAYNKKFRFKSFMGAYKFYKQYAMKTNNGARYLERYEDRIVFCALDLAQGDEQLAINLVDEMINQRFQPATPTFKSGGFIQ